MTPTRYGRLTVLAQTQSPAGPRLHCRCDCGAEVMPRACDVRAGRQVSCGCAGREARIAATTARHAQARAGVATERTARSARAAAQSLAVSTLYAWAQGAQA